MIKGSPAGHRRLLSAVLLLVAATVVSSLASRACAESVYHGVPTITDGDTLKIGDARIRLFGIDAPEREQRCKNAERTKYRCGETATSALREKISGKAVRCEEKDVDRYGRTVAVCFKGDIDLNGWMVSAGYALAYRRYSESYIDEEERAKIAKRGIWAGEFVPPWKWRKNRRRR